MARSLAARASTEDRDELDAIEAFYRRKLTGPAAEERLDWEPVKIGPTWQRDGAGWLLPERTLGWGMLAWCGLMLQAGRDDPWVFTDEQARFLLWWYAVDEAGRFLFRDGVLQRLKGWGKDPIGGCLGLFELVGPCTVGDMIAGQPVGQPHDDPWIQIAAVSLEQTKNTMRLLPNLVTKRARDDHNLLIGKESAYAGNRFLQAVTSSPATLQGARATFVLLNETHEWVSSNGGHDMAYVLSNNATKSKGGAARTLRITNAFEPGLESVAERDRDAWQDVQTGRSVDTGLLYDSLEAAPEAPLTLEAAPAVIRSVRGDSTWLDVDRIVQSIADTRNAASQSRRFWYNQIVAAEDAWADPNQVKAASTEDDLAAGDTVVMFGDGSKSDDATGLVAVRISDGLAKVLHVQQPKKDQIVDRFALDRAVTDAFATYRVVAFWFDPSHAKDDDAEGDSRFWWPLCDEWMARFGRRLKLWPVLTGKTRHAVAFDLSRHDHQGLFVPAVEQCLSDIEGGLVAYHRSDWLAEHVINARRNPNTKWGVTIRKEHRESPRKIDLAVCLVGARMLRRMYLLSNKKGAPGKGRVIVLD
ncbi:terminase [Intrasporangium mesophilum]